MSTFPFQADAIANFQTCSFPARSTRTAANLYARITGIAEFMVDPDWEDYEWHRGTITFETTQPVLIDGDKLLEWVVWAGLREISRDEAGGINPNNDFALAIDSVEPVINSSFGGDKPFGNLTFTLNAAYKGDIWMEEISFSADLLIYRPTLDNLSQLHWHRVDLRQLLQALGLVRP